LFCLHTAQIRRVDKVCVEMMTNVQKEIVRAKCNHGIYTATELYASLLLNTG